MPGDPRPTPGSLRNPLRLGLVLALLAGAACTRQPAARPELPRPNQPAQTLVGASYALTHLGNRRGQLVADSAFVDPSGLDADLRRVRLTAFVDDGQPASVLVAPRAQLRIGSDSLELTGGVVATTTAGDTLRTPRLLVDQGAMRLATDTSFTLKTKTGERAGTGLTTDFGLRPTRAAGNR